jgi:hypothetical protein
MGMYADQDDFGGIYHALRPVEGLPVGDAKKLRFNTRDLHVISRLVGECVCCSADDPFAIPAVHRKLRSC